MSKLWEEVQKLVDAGKRPIIEVPPGARIIPLKRKTPGRPRLFVNRRREGYAIASHTGFPMRCKRRGCNKQLRKKATSICCSEYCENELANYCREVLACLEKRKPATEFPMVYRVAWRRLRRKPFTGMAA